MWRQRERGRGASREPRRPEPPLPRPEVSRINDSTSCTGGCTLPGAPHLVALSGHVHPPRLSERLPGARSSADMSLVRHSETGPFPTGALFPRCRLPSLVSYSLMGLGPAQGVVSPGCRSSTDWWFWESLVFQALERRKQGSLGNRISKRVINN